MNDRWKYKVVDVRPGGGRRWSLGMSADDVQAELDRLGGQGWELVAVVAQTTTSACRLFLKRPG